MGEAEPQDAGLEAVVAAGDASAVEAQALPVEWEAQGESQVLAAQAGYCWAAVQV